MAIPSDPVPGDFTPLFTTRYLAAVGVTAFSYYVLLTFGREIDLIWRSRKWDIPSICFMWNRYSSLAGLLYGAYLTSGIHSHFSESASYVAVTSVAIIAIGTSHAFLAMWMFARWEQQRSAKLAMWIAFAVTFAGLFVSFVFGAKSIHDSTIFSTGLNVCILTKNPKPLMGVWISTLTFDLITIILLITNALDQPYRQRTQVIERVRRDGALCFLVIIVGSLVMLMISVSAGTNGTFEAAFLVWSCDAIVVSRLVLEVGVPVEEDERLQEASESLPNVYELGVRKGGNL